MSSIDSFDVPPVEGESSQPGKTKILHLVVIAGLAPGLYCISWPYPLLESGPVLLAAAILYLCAICVVLGTPFEAGSRIKYLLIALIPWAFAGLFVANGALDHSQEVLHSTKVVDSEYYLRGWNIVVVRSWRPGRKVESLYLKTWLLDKTGFYLEGEPLTVGVRSGALGMPWLTQVMRIRGSARLTLDDGHGSRQHGSYRKKLHGTGASH